MRFSWLIAFRPCRTDSGLAEVDRCLSLSISLADVAEQALPDPARFNRSLERAVATRGPVLLDGDRATGPAMFLEVTLVELLGPVKRRRRGDLRDDLPPYRLLPCVA